MRGRALIIGGTHAKENEFSHSVIKRLVLKLGKEKPDEEFTGIDGARKGKLWLYKGIALGKIEKIGETSISYLESLSVDELRQLVDFKIRNLIQNYPPGIDSIFRGKSQWTSVTGKLINKSKCQFYIDLHSSYNYNDQNGTSMLILDKSKKSFMDEALIMAKGEYPDIYGDGNPYQNTSFYISHDLKRKVKTRDKKAKKKKEKRNKLGREDLIGILTGKLNYSPSNLEKELMDKQIELNKKLYNGWNNIWYLEKKDPDAVSNYTFKAINWKEKQQDAVVNFILNYLMRK